MSNQSDTPREVSLRVSMSRRSLDADESLDMAGAAGPETLGCHPDATLLDVWNELAAITQAKVKWTQGNQPHSVDFLDGQDRSIRGHGLFGVTEAGRLTVKDTWQELRISEIQGAEAKGLYAAPLNHIEFLDHPPVGNGFWMDWDSLRAALNVLDETLVIVGTISAAATAKRWAGVASGTVSDLLLGRGAAAIKMVDEYRQQWESGNLYPEDIGSFLHIDSVNDGDRQQLLGVRSMDNVEILKELLDPELRSGGLAPIGRALLRFYYVETDELPARLAIQLLEESLDAPTDDVPSNDLFLKCVCPKDCGCFVEISSIAQGVKFGFTAPTDHFVIRRSRLDQLDDYSGYMDDY